MSLIYKGIKITASGATDYDKLNNKPTINGQTLEGDIEIETIKEVTSLPTGSSISHTVIYKRGGSLFWNDGATWVELSNTGSSYNAGSGLELSGNTINHKNSVTASTDGKGGAMAIPTIKYDDEGHITSVDENPAYPPTTVGTANQYLKSQGSGNPTWQSGATAPQQNGVNLITSGGVFDAIGTKGSATKPVYTSSGLVVEGSDYAGGTKVNLNGMDKGASEATIYAPTTAGSAGQVLTSNGTGAPYWSSASGGGGVPIGTVVPFAGDEAPEGWLMCDGNTYYSKSAETGADTIYSNLYRIIGTKFGKGSVANTFKVPDMRQKFVEGANADETGFTVGTSIAAAIPTHGHTFTGSAMTGYIDMGGGDSGEWYGDFSKAAKSGVFSWSDSKTSYRYTGLGSVSPNRNIARLNFNGTPSGTISAPTGTYKAVYNTNCTTVQPASVCMNYIIKY